MTEQTPAEKLIEVARAEDAKRVREVGGMNRGPDVEKYQKAVHLPAGAPWCAAFVSWVYMASQELVVAPLWCSGSAVTLWHRGTRKMLPEGYTTPEKADYQSKVRPGMIWVRAKDADGAKSARRGTWLQGHTGIVVAVDADGFHTVEGNTNGAGSREGDGVYSKLHKWSYSTDILRTVGWFDPEYVGRLTPKV